MSKLIITSGTMPTVALGTESVGYFTTGYWNAPPISFEFSLDAATWSSTVTVLGGAVSQEWGPQYQGKRAVGTVKVTPTLVGTATFMMRIRTADGVTGPFSFVNVEAFQAAANFPAISFEVSTNNSTWTTAANGIQHTATSDGGLVVVIRDSARYIRLNGSTVIDSGGQQAEKFLKFSETGSYQWMARDTGHSNVRQSIVADDSGIFWVRANGTTATSLIGASGATTGVSARLVPREWVVCKLTNAGEWDSFTRVAWSSTSGTGQPTSPTSVAVGGGRLVLGITANPNNHTITYGNNLATASVTTSVVRAGALALDTGSLHGMWAYIDSSSFQAQPAVAVAADGRTAIVTAQGSSSTSRAFRLQTYDTAGASQGFITITAQDGYVSTSSQDPQAAVEIDQSQIFVLMLKSGSSSRDWSSNAAPWAPLTVPAGNHSVWWVVDRGTQMQAWEAAYSIPSLSVTGRYVKRSTGGDFLVTHAETSDDYVYRVDGATGSIEWTATGRDLFLIPSCVSSDANGVLFLRSQPRTGTTEHLVDGDGTTTTTLTTGRNWLACLNNDGQWGKRATSSGVGGTEPSAPFSTDWPFLELVEDTPFTAIVQGFDPELSPGAVSLQVWDPRTDEWIDNPTSFTPEVNGVYPATLSVTMGADIFTGATVLVTPLTGYNGKLDVLFRWKIVDDAFQTRFGPAAEFSATWLSDAPSAPTGIAPTLTEDVPSTMTVAWTDLNETGGASGKYELYAAELQADGENWRPKSWTKLGEKNTDNLTLEVASMSTTALEATIALNPKKNKSGTYRFALKVKETTGKKQESAYTIFQETITDLPDIPEIDGRFNPIDPDGDGVDIELSPYPDGPWGDCITLPDGTRLCVNNDGGIDVDVRGPDARYIYYVRAKDSTGQVSQPKRVVGFHGNGATGAYPQRIIRNGSGVVTAIEPMFFLFGITALRFEEGLDGVGYAEVNVASDQLKRRAQESNTSITSLLDPMSVELVVTYKGIPVFVGPITEVEWQTGSATTYITARGLLSYFDKRIIKVDTEYEPADLSDIAATMAAQSQGEPWGGLGIGTDTTDCGTEGTVPLTAGTTVLDALNAASEKLDGPEIWVDPVTRTLKAYPTRGTDRRDRVRITSAMAGVAELKVRAETLVTVARVVGADNGAGGNYESTYVSPTRLAIYGRIEKNYSAPQLETNGECAAVAERIVLARHNTTPNLVLDVTITPQRQFDLLDVGVGDVVTVDIEDPQFGRILGDYRIVNRAADLVDQADGTYRIRLNVEPALYVDGKLVGSRSRFNPAVVTELVGLSVNERRG